VDPSEAELGYDAIVKITEAGKWSVSGKILSTHRRSVTPASSLSLRKKSKVSFKSSTSSSSSTSSPAICNTCGDLEGSCSTAKSSPSSEEKERTKKGEGEAEREGGEEENQGWGLLVFLGGFVLCLFWYIFSSFFRDPRSPLALYFK
jgi:uncharacterized low-complexity protein